MRIINQLKTISYSFDNCEIFVSGKKIFVNSQGRIEQIARYENERRAIEVFKDLHMFYGHMNPVYEMPQY